MFSFGTLGAAQSPAPVVTGAASMAVVSSSDSIPFGSATYFNGMYIVFPGSQSRSTYNTSTDGITWTSRSLPDYNSWGDISTLPNLLLSTLGFFTNTVYTSTDGISWTARTLPVQGYFWKFVQTSTGTIIGLSSNGVYAVVVSNDNGVTWTSGTNPLPSNYAQIVSDGQSAYLFSNSQNRIYESLNGVNWEYQNISPSPVNDSTIIFAGKHVIATEVNRIFFTVPDSRNLFSGFWGRYPLDFPLYRIVYDPVTQIYVASSSTENVLYFSRNLEDWETKTFGAVNSHSNYRSLAAYNGKAIVAPFFEVSNTTFSSRIYTLEYS